MGGVHIGNRADGNTQLFLVHGGNVQRDAAAAGVADGLALEVACKVILGAEAGGALNAVQDKVQIGGKLRNVVPERPDAQVHRAAACSLEELGGRDALFNAERLGVRGRDVGVQRHDGRVVGDVVVLFDAVDQTLDGHVGAVLFELLQNFGDKAGAVFNALSAVFVLARVVEAGKEVCRHVEACAVELDHLEADVIKAFGNLDHTGLLGMDVVDGHLVLAHAETGDLIAEDGTVFGTAVYQLLDIRKGIRIVFAAFRHFQPADRLNKDQFDAALGKIEIIAEKLVRHTGKIGRRAGGGFYHAVVQLDIPDLEGGKQRFEFHVGCSELGPVQLGVEVSLGNLVEDLDRLFGGDGRVVSKSCGRTGDRLQSSHCADADSTGGDAFQKVSAGNVCCHGITVPFL